MRTLSRLAATVLTVFSGIAFCTTAMTGVVAAVVFPLMKEFQPVLPAFESYSGSHWSLLAGLVAEKVFNIGFAVAGVSLSLSLAGVLTLAATRKVGGFPVVRSALVSVTLGLFLTHVGWVQPRMDEAARKYRDAAVAGRTDEALEAKGGFDELHPVASKLIGASSVSALLLFAASAWGATSGRRADADEGGGDS